MCRSIPPIVHFSRITGIHKDDGVVQRMSVGPNGSKSKVMFSLVSIRNARTGHHIGMMEANAEAAELADVRLHQRSRPITDLPVSKHSVVVGVVCRGARPRSHRES